MFETAFQVKKRYAESSTEKHIYNRRCDYLARIHLLHFWKLIHLGLLMSSSQSIMDRALCAYEDYDNTAR
jgi:hypothetical protein